MTATSTTHYAEFPAGAPLRHLMVITCLFLLMCCFGAGSLQAAIYTEKPTAVEGRGRKTIHHEKYRAGELLVKFRSDVSHQARERVHGRLEAVQIREFPQLNLHRVKVKTGMTVEEAIGVYQADPAVEYAEPDYAVKIQAQPNDPDYAQLWGMAKINAPAAWDMTTGSSNVVIAVIDTGVDYNHPDLRANLWSSSTGFGYNAITQTHDPLDDHGHGTHVSGTIGAVGNNAVGVAGVNWHVKIMACKALDAAGNGFDSDIIACLQHIKALKDSGVNIVATNNSYGYHGEISQAVYDAIKAQQDILFIAAAGNNGIDSDKTPFYPANYKLPNVISVGAITSAGNKADFSNYGRYGVHVAAPGDAIYSTYLNGSYELLSGTSMAAPHVTGLAGLLKAKNMTRNSAALRNLLLTGGNATADIASKTMTGKTINAAGSLSCSGKTLFSPWEFPTAPVPGLPVTVSVISITCDRAVGPVTAVVSNGDSLVVRDDGIAPDISANDGIFTGTWTPSSTEAAALTFTSTIGTAMIAVPPVRIAALPPVPPAVDLGRSTMCATGTAFGVKFTSAGGLLPLTWGIASGTLPPGLALNVLTGEISGTALTAGAYNFVVEVTDSALMKDRLPWAIAVNSDLRTAWPQVLQNRLGWGLLETFSASPVMADLDGDGKKEIIAVDVDTLYVFDASGNPIAKTVLPAAGSTPAVADIDGDGQKEILVGVSHQYKPIYAFRADLTLMPNFPAGGFADYHSDAGFVHPVATADLNNDGRLAIIGVSSPSSPTSAISGQNLIMMVDGNGASVAGWPKTVETYDYLFNILPIIPTIADIDGDGKREVVLANRDGFVHVFRKDGTEVKQWQYSPNQIGWVSPAVVADINSDGFPETVLRYSESAARDTVIAAYDRNGNLMPNWPQRFANFGDSGVSLADIDNDGKLEIIFIAGGYMDEVHVLRHDGTEAAGWPVSMNQYSAQIGIDPIIADIDNDGRVEIIVAASLGINTANLPIQGMLFGFSSQGTLLSGFPKYTSPGNELRSTPALGDLDGNGRMDVVQKCEDGMLYVWEFPQTVVNPIFDWPMRFHDLSHSNAAPPRFMITTPSALPDGVLGVPYSASLSAAGGKAPYTWTIVAGALPAVLSLEAATGTLRGTPTAAGSTTFTLQAKDANGSTFQRQFTIKILAPPLTILTSSLPEGNVSSPYLQTLSAAYGKAPYVWAITAGTLPAGLTLGATTGTISGTPLTTGSWTFTVRAKDANLISTSKVFTLVIKPALPDLTVTSVSGPSSATRGKTATVSATVKNIGKGIAAGSTLTLYLSTDAAITTGDIALGNKTISTLQSGSSQSVTATVTIPWALTAGRTYYWGAIIDSPHLITETNESNNAKTGGTLTIR